MVTPRVQRDAEYSECCQLFFERHASLLNGEGVQGRLSLYP
jgi:hypothetical protein